MNIFTSNSIKTFFIQFNGREKIYQSNHPRIYRKEMKIITQKENIEWSFSIRQNTLKKVKNMRVGKVHLVQSHSK